jgi:molybdopterin/thiamine biosynthesis adenylyltransferase
MLSDDQIERYSRQIILRQVGGKGQEKLLRSRIFVDVAGAMQTSTLHYLAAVGVGALGVFSSPQNSHLISLASPQEHNPFHVLTRLNPDCSITLHSRGESKTAVHRIVQNYDVILSDSDLLHDACYRERKPFLYATVAEAEAWLIVCQGYKPDSPCLRCVQSLLPATSVLSPFIETIALFMGAHLATEAITHLLDFASSLGTQLLRFRFPDFHCRAEIVHKVGTCPLCRHSSYF